MTHDIFVKLNNGHNIIYLYLRFKETVCVVSSIPPCKDSKRFPLNLYLLNTISYLNDNAFNGSVIKQALSSLHGGSQKISITVP